MNIEEKDENIIITILKKDIMDNINSKILDEEKKENIEELKELAKEQYNSCYDKSKNNDVKVGILMTFQAVLISYILSNSTFIKMLNIEFVNKYGLNTYNLFFVLNILILILCIIPIMLSLLALIARKGQYFSVEIYSKKYIEEKELKQSIIETYKDLIQKNELLLKDKTKMFNLSAIIIVINICIIIVDYILKICLIK